MSEMRDELLRHAENLVRRRGYSGFSYADVSERVGIRKASIHYHFPTKEIMVSTVLDSYRQRYKNALTRIEAHSDNALDRIDAYGRLYLTGVDKGLGCLCAALTAELEILPEELRAGTEAFFRAPLEWVQKVYEEGLRNRQVNSNLEGRAAARLVVTSLEGALMMERMLDGASGFELTLSSLRSSLGTGANPTS